MDWLVCGDDIWRSPQERCSECGTRFRRGDARIWSAERGLPRRWGVRRPIVHRWIVETSTSVKCTATRRLGAIAAVGGFVAMVGMLLVQAFR